MRRGRCLVRRARAKSPFLSPLEIVPHITSGGACVGGSIFLKYNQIRKTPDRKQCFAGRSPRTTHPRVESFGGIPTKGSSHVLQTFRCGSGDARDVPLLRQARGARCPQVPVLRNGDLRRSGRSWSARCPRCAQGSRSPWRSEGARSSGVASSALALWRHAEHPGPPETPGAPAAFDASRSRMAPGAFAPRRSAGSASGPWSRRSAQPASFFVLVSLIRAVPPLRSGPSLVEAARVPHACGFSAIECLSRLDVRCGF